MISISRKLQINKKFLISLAVTLLATTFVFVNLYIWLLQDILWGKELGLILYLIILIFLIYRLYNNAQIQVLDYNELLRQNIELQRAQENLSREKGKLATLFEVTHLIMSTWDLELLLYQIMSLTKKIIDFKTGRILLPENDNLIIKYHFGYDKGKGKIKKVRLGEGICGLAAKNKEIIIVKNVKKDKRYIKELDDTVAEIAVPLIFQGELLGILDIQNDKPFNWLDENEECLETLVLFSNFMAMALHNSKTYNQLKDTYINTIKALARAIDAKDPYTHGHCERVKRLSLEIGRELGLDPKDLEELEFAALLHDIGKIGLPESILSKPGKLTNQEFELIKSHPSIGAEMIGDIPFLQRTKRIIAQHHERIDGKGYPKGIKGSQMDFLAKIIAVADAVDAMLNNRPYRIALSIDYVLRELDNCKGTQFDPLVVNVAKELIRKSEYMKVAF